MARYNSHHESGPIYAAAEVWRDRCLVADGSILQDGLNLWTPGLVDELDTRFVQNLDEGDGDFFEKLKSQLGGGSPECRQLMAEVLWILMLFQSNIGAAKKRENVRAVWSWSGNQLPEDHPMLSDAVLDGLGSAGTAYNTHRWREISFLIAALRDLKGRGELGRAALLQDGWAFAEWLSKQNGARNRQLPHILTHLVFPDTFERISSAGEKRAILAAFGEVSDKELRKWDFTPIDKALLDLRHRFEEERGGDIDFYEKEFTKDWRASIGTWLLSWNPTKWEWATLKQDRAKTIVGQAATHAWRCASTLPREGDHVYLARTGVEPKGIVAFGTVARASYDAPHYDSTRAKAGETSRFIDVDFSEGTHPVKAAA